MSKKDYELIAATIRRVTKLCDLPQSTAAIIRQEFAVALIGTNSRFNADRFLTAATEK